MMKHLNYSKKCSPLRRRIHTLISILLGLSPSRAEQRRSKERHTCVGVHSPSSPICRKPEGVLESLHSSKAASERRSHNSGDRSRPAREKATMRISVPFTFVWAVMKRQSRYKEKD